jgi:DNA-binding PadR family transcriptional regulator
MTENDDPLVQSFLPLSPAVFQILLVLVDGESHGYSIVKQVEEETAGRLRIEPANLYRSLRRLLKQGVIEESDSRPDPDLDDSRRRYFRLTALGERVVRAEALRLEYQVRAARMRSVLPTPGTAEESQ